MIDVRDVVLDSKCYYVCTIETSGDLGRSSDIHVTRGPISEVRFSASKSEVCIGCSWYSVSDVYNTMEEVLESIKWGVS